MLSITDAVCLSSTRRSEHRFEFVVDLAIVLALRRVRPACYSRTDGNCVRIQTPMLETAHGEEEHVRDLDELIAKVGHRKVVYGVVDEPSHIESSSVAAEKADRPVPAPIADATATNNVGRGRSVRLGVDDPTRIRPVSGIYSRAGSSSEFADDKSEGYEQTFLQRASRDMADIHETSL